MCWVVCWEETAGRGELMRSNCSTRPQVAALQTRLPFTHAAASSNNRHVVKKYSSVAASS